MAHCEGVYLLSRATVSESQVADRSTSITHGILLTVDSYIHESHKEIGMFYTNVRTFWAGP